MDKRHRSPSYPQMSIKEAVDRVGMLYKAIGSHPTSREVVAKGLGYSSISGTSATAIGNLYKYGLLEGRAEEVRVSDRAMAILHPHSDAERKEALLAAALEPELFRELSQRFPGSAPNDDVLRNYLLRNKFAPQAVESAILAYRETLEFVSGETGAYDSAMSSSREDHKPMQLQSHVQNPALGAIVADAAIEKPIGRWDFEDGNYVRILATAGIDTEEALDMVETLVELKRKEIARMKNRKSESESD